MRLLRLEKRLTEGGLAARLQKEGIDLDRVAIGRIENGQRRVTDYELLALAAALEVKTVEEILLGEGAITLEEYAHLPKKQRKPRRVQPQGGS